MHITKRSKKVTAWLLSLTAVAVLGACSTGPSAVQGLKPVVQKITVDAVPLGQNQSGVVVYRAAGTGDANKPVNLYINGQYQASLLPGGYTAAGVCSADARLFASEYNAQQGVPGIESAGVPVDMQVGQTYYYEAVPIAGGVRLRPSTQAEASAARTEQQMHTYPRYQASNCGVKVAQDQPKKTFTVAADALFPFARGGVEDINADGRRALQTLAERLRSDFSRLDRIEIVGHADPVGSDAGAPERKRILSTARANAVRSLLANNGIDSKTISAVGRGDTQLLQANCPNSPAAVRDACNAPNRRVEVKVFGLTK